MGRDVAEIQEPQILLFLKSCPCGNRVHKMSFITNQWLLFLAFILIGCGMGGNARMAFHDPDKFNQRWDIGAYLGLFNCTICIPQICSGIWSEA